MTEKIHKVMLSIPGYSPDMLVGTYFSQESAIALAGKIARGEIVLCIESETRTTETDVFYSPEGGTD
jgi:hypothetical protein